jgi:hypothetical protein
VAKQRSQVPTCIEGMLSAAWPPYAENAPIEALIPILEPDPNNNLHGSGHAYNVH